MYKLWPLVALMLCVACAPAVQDDGDGDGDVVTLVERGAGVPAHARPGDDDVAFRFAGGSRATVLAIDPETGWLQIRAAAVGGAEAIGWITRRYVVDQRGLDSASTEQARREAPRPGGLPEWCPPMRSPDPRPAGRLRLATWNLANLHADDGRSTFTGDDPSEKRYQEDYDRIRCYVRLFDPDILAVQEVDGRKAIERVVDTDVYDVHASSRTRPANMHGRQNTGFAFKKGLAVERRPDYEALDPGNGALRYGARIDVAVGGTTLKLMNVHLKSGCFSNGHSGPACAKLFAQLPELERWIDEQAAGADPFVVLGDFNRNLDSPGDTVWSELDDARPANADLTTITEDMAVNCRDHRRRTFIDHIVFDKRSARLVDPSTARQIDYRHTDRSRWDKISDHCPVVVDLGF